MILEILYGFLATIGFSILFNVPKEHIITAGLSGAIGWVGYLIIMNISNSSIAATFTASVLIGIMSEFFAKRTKNPATMFIIPSIIPLVPGLQSYQTIYAILEKDNERALSLGILTVGLALAIASGLMVVTSFVRIRRRTKTKS